ncbi:hypothetical protein DSO57_1033322 [Entomophthora muscae]|uniref:Uncharacterized protein n=1 Tax=Entomophthora muscae TaxID=34485 RepID=A0ACC2TB96_9FUNG|nr:hypothetical protein DSO57_1033322 [Entomophthora muscae]
MKKGITSLDSIKYYLHYFAHAAICHNRSHLGRQQIIQEYYQKLIDEMQVSLKKLYVDLAAKLPIIGQQTGKLEQSLQSYVPAVTQQIMKQMGIESSWVGVVTNHVKGSREILKHVVHELERLGKTLPAPATPQETADGLDTYQYTNKKQLNDIWEYTCGTQDALTAHQRSTKDDIDTHKHSSDSKMEEIWAYICGTQNELRITQTSLVILTEQFNNFSCALAAKAEVPRDTDNVTSRAVSRLSVNSQDAMPHSSEFYGSCEKETQDPRSPSNQHLNG